MAVNLKTKGMHVIAFDVNQKALQDYKTQHGLIPATTIGQMAKEVDPIIFAD